MRKLRLPLFAVALAIVAALAATVFASTLTTTIIASIAASEVSPLDLGSPLSALDYSKRFALANGTGNNQADLIWHDQRTLAASATEDLDLVGTQTRQLGGTFSPVKIRALMVCAATANTNDVLVGGASANQVINWVGDPTDVVKVKPGGCFLLVAPTGASYALTAGTGDLLKIANSAGSTSVTYDIVVIGTSA